MDTKAMMGKRVMTKQHSLGASAAKRRRLCKPKANDSTQERANPQTAAAGSQVKETQVIRNSEDRLLAALHGLLLRLPPESRRAAIQQKLSECHRLALERWMMQRGQSSAAREEPSPKAPAKAAHVSISGGRYFASVSLGHGLHAQSGGFQETKAAADALACMVTLRSKAHALARSLGFERSLLLAFGATSQALGFRTRTTLAPKLRTWTPLRQDLASALKDWQSLRRASRQHTRAETAQAWSKMWKDRGRPSKSLAKAMSAMNRVGIDQASTTSAQLTRLLAHKMWGTLIGEQGGTGQAQTGRPVVGDRGR